MRGMVWFPIAAALLVGCQVHGDLTGQFACVEDPRCPEGFSCVAGKCLESTGSGAPCATTDQLSTSFDGTAPPAWVDPDLFAGGTLAVAGGELVLTVPANPTNAHASLSSYDAYDLRTRAIELEVTAVGAGTTEMGLRDTSGAEVYFGVDGTELFAYSKGRTLIKRPYAPTTDRWWRFRDDGAELVWETSADRSTWTVLSRDREPLNPTWVSLMINLNTSGAPASTARFSTINPGVDSTIAWCPLASWNESFADGVLPPHSDSYGQNCTVAEVGGKLTMTTTGVPGSCGHGSTRPLDARDAVLASAVAPAAQQIGTELKLADRQDKNILSMEASDTLRFYVRAAGVGVLDASAALNPATQQYWRIAVVGAQVRFEASSNGTTWETLASANAPTLDASAMYIARSTYLSAPATVPAAATASFGELIR